MARVSVGSLASVLINTALSGSFLTSTELHANEQATLVEGKSIVFDARRGNCLACHQIDNGIHPGDIGPPLVAMKARFQEKAQLRALIWDAAKNNPDTRMPPFGRHKILSEQEIDKVVEYIFSL